VVVQMPDEEEEGTEVVTMVGINYNLT